MHLKLELYCVLLFVLLSEGLAANVTLRWDENGETNLAGYFVYRSEYPGSPQRLNSSPVPVTSYTDTTVVAGHVYRYAVTAITNDNVESDFSADAIYEAQITNSPPLVVKDSVSTFVNTPIQINVLDNDTDPDGDSIRVAHVTQGTLGTVTIQGSKVLTYTPHSGVQGLDSFSYTVTDSIATAVGQVFVSIQPQQNVAPPPEENVDSVTGAQHLFFPSSLPSDNPLLLDTFVGVAVMNMTAQQTSVQMTSLSKEGTALTTSFLESPLAANGQNAFLTDELPLGGKASSTVQFSSPDGGLAGFFMVGDYPLNRMDGIGNSLAKSTELTFPLISEDAQHANILELFNATLESTPANIEVVTESGEVIDSRTFILPAKGTLLGTLSEHFQRAVSLPSKAYARVTSQQPITGFGITASQESITAVPGLTGSRARSLYAAHFLSDPNGNDTELRLVNTDEDTTASITLQVFNQSSSLLLEESLLLEGGQMLVQSVRSLLLENGIPGASTELFTGYLKVVQQGDFAERSDLCGSVTFLVNNGRAQALLPLVTTGGQETLLPHVAQSPDGIFTGVALLNYSSSAATVDVQAFDEAGILTANRSLQIPPRSRVVNLLDEAPLFGQGFSQINGHVRISSSIPVITFSLFGDYAQNYLSAVEGQVVQP